MAEELRFFHSRLRIEELLVVDTIIHKGIDREVTHSERGKILEEMRTLAGINAVISQSRLHFTGIPSHVSLLPQRPGPTST